MNSRKVKIGDKNIGDSFPCFITFEAGPTHNGFQSALRLVEAAAESGADAIKFQIFDPDELIFDRKQMFTYSILLDKNTGQLKEVSEPLYDIFKRRQLSYEQWKLVKKKADQLNLMFFATAGSIKDINLLIDLNCHSVKIASADINHLPLLHAAANSNMVVQIDTGSADLVEIHETINFLESEGCSKIIIHQCPSGYPARLESICLRMISTLRNAFPKYPIAYSDHTPDADIDIAAVALGANLVEKTITFDRATPSVEHVFSLEPVEFTSFIERIRDVEIAMGNFTRSLSDEQKIKRNMVRRSPYTVSDIKAGTALSDVEVKFMRPCEGISPSEWYEHVNSNKFFSKNVLSGHVIRASDIHE